MNKKKYFITGGGTGGHIYPAIAVADELLNSKDTEKIYYVGNPNNLEYKIVSYTFLPVSSSGMPRKIGLGLICWAFEMFFAFLKCIKYIKQHKPDVIFGTGGYVSAPVLLAAIVLRVPFVMHDCDANPGLVTRKLAPYAKSVSVAFEAGKKLINNDNCFVNGNPIRNIFSELTKKEAKKNLNLEEKLTLCIMGGSQGAKTINDAAIEILQKLSKKLDIQVIFQTGNKNFNEVIERLNQIYPEYKNDKNIIVAPYFDDMPVVLKASDIAISRAGSLSISELCASLTVPIFVPYPYAAADHQRKNAKYMVNNGCGLYLEDSDTRPETVLALVESLAKDKNKIETFKKSIEKFAKYDGAEKIAAQVKNCAKN